MGGGRGNVPDRDFESDHDEFVQDEGGEGDGDDVEELVLEEDEGDDHDGRACGWIVC